MHVLHLPVEPADIIIHMIWALFHPSTPRLADPPHTPAERIGLGRLTALLAPDPDAERRVMEFFTAHMRNPHTRNAYVEELRQKHANLNGAEHAPVGRAAARW